MNKLKNASLALLLVTTVAATAIAWREYVELIPLRAAALAPSERVTLLKKAAFAEEKAAQAQDALRAIRTEQAAGTNGVTPLPTSATGSTSAVASSDAAAAAGGAAAGGDNGPAAAAKKQELMLALLNNPSGLKLLNDQIKKQVQKDYGALLKNLALPPEIKAQVADLLAQRQGAFVDVAGAALSQGIKPNPNSPLIKDLVAAAQAGLDTRIQNLVGPGVYSQYQNYQNTLMLRETAADISKDLNQASAPLTPAQRAQLTNSLVNSAQKILNPAQLQALSLAQQQQASKDQMQQISEIVKQAQKPANNNTSGNTGTVAKNKPSGG